MPCKFFNKFILVLTLALCVFGPASAAVDYIIEDVPQIVQIAQELPLKGCLQQKSNGFVYLKISDDYIEKIFPLLEAHVAEIYPQGVMLVPLPLTGKKCIGAHISVMYETELVQNDIWSIPELGQEFTFQIKEVRTVKILGPKPKKLWLIAVEAPALESLRESYGLTPKLKGHDFHITIGHQKPGKAAKKDKKEELQEAA